MFEGIVQDDSKHRARWRELYTTEECDQLKELVDAAEKQVISSKRQKTKKKSKRETKTGTQATIHAAADKHLTIQVIFDHFVSGSDFLLWYFPRARHALL